MTDCMEKQVFIKPLIFRQGEKIVAVEVLDRGESR